jgi:2-polyprenyl-3-methyl-5-hydroxy-6-metoxy-1,4-benzoquinol methylase
MHRHLKGLATRIIDKLADRIARHVGESLSSSGKLADEIAYRVALERIPSGSIGNMNPYEIFSNISDDFWFWLCTEGYKRKPALEAVLPGMPTENVQLAMTGNKGNSVMKVGFTAYTLFRDMYEREVGPITRADAILDFGCGWGRIIRFFLKDVEPSKLWGVDPARDMIELCQNQNKWCNFKAINTKPPSPFEEGTFDLIYSFSVFSHLSEEMHKNWLIELSRILKPGGLLIATTRDRAFIEHCAELRKQEDLQQMHPGPASSARAFPSPAESLAVYDSGKYTFSQLVSEGEWSYWGEAAISKDYVLSHWTPYLTFIDYIDDRQRCTQNAIVMRKPHAR